MSNLTATLKSQIYVGTNKAASVLADYTSDTLTLVHGVSDLGEHGDEAEEIKFQTIEDGRVHKLKGAYDSGDLSLVVGRDATDPGQIKLRAGLAVADDINFKIVFNDAPPGGTPTSRYFRAKVMSAKTSMKDANQVVTETFNLGITSEILEVPAASA